MGIICPPPIDIGLTDVPKTGDAMAAPPPGTPRDDTPAYATKTLFGVGFPSNYGVGTKMPEDIHKS